VICEKYNYVKATNKFNPYNEDYLKIFGPNFKVVLIASFNQIKDFIGFDFIRRLYDIS